MYQKKCHFYLLHFLFFVPLIYVQAQNANAGKVSLSGIITDASTGNTLAGATILYADLEKGTISKNDGTYIMPPVLPGNYLVVVSYQGYLSAALHLEIKSGVTKNFALKPTIIEQKEVVVTGVTSGTRIKQAPQPINVLKKEELTLTTSTNAIDAIIKNVPGVSGVSTGPAITKPFIRGLGYNRVLTINDGIRQEGQQWGDEHGIEIDDYSIQKIEVLKGPASLLYGSDAIAGVINIISQDAIPVQGIRSNIISEYQTNNGLGGLYGNITGTEKNFSFNAYSSYKTAHDYRNKSDGFVFNSKFTNKNVGGMLAIKGDWGFSKLIVSNVHQQLGIVTGLRDSVSGSFIKELPGGIFSVVNNNDFRGYKPATPYQNIDHFKIASDNNFALGNARLDVTLGYQNNNRKEFGTAEDYYLPNSWMQLQTINYAGIYHLPFSKNVKTSFGINGMVQRNANKGSEVIIPGYDLFDIGAFGYTSYSSKNFTVSGGLRYDLRTLSTTITNINGQTKFDALNAMYNNVSASAGFSYEATDHATFKMNIARGFRAPNIAELKSNGAHEGTFRYEVGNKELRSEISTQADAGLELSSEHVLFNANIFYNHIKYFIFYEKTRGSGGADSMLLDEESGEMLQVFNYDQQQANLYGAEVSIDIHPHPLDWLHFKNVFSYTRGKFQHAVDGSNSLPLIPAARLLSEISLQFFKQGSTIKNLGLHFESDLTLKQDHAFTGFNTETATPSYWLINAGINADIVSRSKTLFTIIFNGENLTNTVYQNHLSRFKYLPVNNSNHLAGVFNAGTNYNVKVNIPITWKS